MGTIRCFTSSLLLLLDDFSLPAPTNNKMVKALIKTSTPSKSENGLSKASLTIQKPAQPEEREGVREILSTLHDMLPKCEGEGELEIMQQAIYYIQDLRDLLNDNNGHSSDLQQLVNRTNASINSAKSLVPSAV